MCSKREDRTALTGRPHSYSTLVKVSEVSESQRKIATCTTLLRASIKNDLSNWNLHLGVNEFDICKAVGKFELTSTSNVTIMPDIH